MLVLSICCLITLADRADSRDRFEESDWISWGDSRRIRFIEVGRNTVFFASDAGILRWDRQERRWLYPWFTVPGYMDKAILLKNCRKVYEDPLTQDIYVETSGGWIFRDHLREKWEKIDKLDGIAWERINAKERKKVKPSRHLMLPPFYSLTPEEQLEYRYLRWDFTKGKHDPTGLFFYSWDGFGVGIADEYSLNLELYPGGPGAASAFDVAGDDIWVTSTLDREKGWLWHRNRDNDSWNFYHPNLEWGLEPGKVNRLKISDNGIVWLATSEGVMVRNGKSWRHIRKKDGLPRKVIRDIAPFGNEKAWVATIAGLALIDSKSGTVLRPDEKTENVQRYSDFHQVTTLKDTLWAAGAGILLRYDEMGGWQNVAGAPTIAAATPPLALFVSDQAFAIGDKMGFAYRDSTGRWYEIFSDRWRGGKVLCIVYHAGYFWLGTDSGLVKFDPREGDVIHYTVDDGLAGNIVREIVPEGDWLWLGTNRALARFRWHVKGRLD